MKMGLKNTKYLSSCLKIIFISMFVFIKLPDIYSQLEPYSNGEFGDVFVRYLESEPRIAKAKKKWENDAINVMKTYINQRCNFDDFAYSCFSFKFHHLLIDKRDTLYSLLLNEKSKIDYTSYRVGTTISLLDSLGLFKDKVIYKYNQHVAARYNIGTSRGNYKKCLKELLDPENYKNDSLRFPNSPEADHLYPFNVFKLAQEIIFINDKEMNKMFWQGFNCKREIPCVFQTVDDEKETGMVSVAFLFGIALAEYFYDPLLYNMQSTPFSLALVNGEPFDPKVYNDFIPMMEKLVYYISCNKIKIPFLIKFDKKVRGMEDWRYKSQPLPKKYYSIPEECSGKGREEFPLNFYPKFYYDK